MQYRVDGLKEHFSTDLGENAWIGDILIAFEDDDASVEAVIAELAAILAVSPAKIGRGKKPAEPVAFNVGEVLIRCAVRLALDRVQRSEREGTRPDSNKDM